jgi:hypothetical protein
MIGKVLESYLIKLFRLQETSKTIENHDNDRCQRDRILNPVILQKSLECYR